jgi:hypothetical protein
VITIMQTRLVFSVASLVTLLTASFPTVADQSGNLVGVHEIPSFVTDRIELLPSSASGDRLEERDGARPPRAEDTSRE